MVFKDIVKYKLHGWPLLTMNERARTAKPSLIVMAAVTRVGAD